MNEIKCCETFDPAHSLMAKCQFETALICLRYGHALSLNEADYYNNQAMRQGVQLTSEFERLNKIKKLVEQLELLIDDKA